MLKIQQNEVRHEPQSAVFICCQRWNISSHLTYTIPIIVATVVLPLSMILMSYCPYSIPPSSEIMSHCQLI